MDLFDLQTLLPDTSIVTANDGRTRLFTGERLLVLSIAAWTDRAETSIAGLAVVAPGSRFPASEIYFLVGEWSQRLETIAQAVIEARPVTWLGDARDAYVEVRESATIAVAMAAAAIMQSADLWPAAELRHTSAGSTLIVVADGTSMAASLDLEPTLRNEIAITARLGSHVYYEAAAPLPDAPAASVDALESLRRGRRLERFDALTVQREKQKSVVDALGLNPWPGSISAAAASNAFEMMVARFGGQRAAL